MSTSHTPGPWEFLGDPEDGECRVRQSKSVRKGQGYLSEITICDQVNKKANANLISAAPDLLAALEAARDLWGDYLPPGNSNAMKAMKMVDAAIAKARGGK